MEADTSRTGLLISALGGLALAIGVFMPWYGVSFTQAAVDTTTSVLNNLSSQYGNAGLRVGATFGQYANGLVGHEAFSMSGHQALTRISIVLLVVGVIATLIALFALAQSRPTLPANGGATLVLGGGLAVLLILYRILTPPDGRGLLSLTVKPAAWICLLGSVAIVLGTIWSREEAGARAADASVWSDLSGWTPGD